MKILITGASGMLGQYLCPLLQKNHQIKATSRSSLDITDSYQVQKIFSEFQPQIVVHLAALTNVDECEKNQSQAFYINTMGTENIAYHSGLYNATVVYISTGMVYSGCKTTPYIEYDDIKPANIYGRSKLMGEYEVMRYTQNFYILRTAWLFGGGMEDKKFVAKMIELGKRRKSLQVVNDKWGSPTYTKDLAQGIQNIIATKRYGIYHMANQGHCNRAQLARKIFAFAKIDCAIEEVSSAYFPAPAPRPYMEALVNYKLDLLGNNTMRNWQEALQEYIEREICDL